MSTSIDNILIPIAHSYNTQKAVTEATKLAKPWQTTIHLVSLMHPGNPFLILRPASAFKRMLNNNLDSYLKALLNLMHWKDLIEKSSPGVAVRIHIKAGFSWQSLILRTTQKVGVGMIILAPGTVRHWFAIRSTIPIHLLAQKTGCNILSLKAKTALGLSEKVEILCSPVTKKLYSTNKRFAGCTLHAFHQSLSKN
jgi:hypothetical protein